MSTKQKFAHIMVAETAKEIAGCFYEELAHDNEFYKFYPSQKMFVQREYKRFIDAAKASLALLLNKSSTTEFMKDEIMDALIKHASMPGNIDKRVAAKIIADGDVPELKGTVH